MNQIKKKKKNHKISTGFTVANKSTLVIFMLEIH